MRLQQVFFSGGGILRFPRVVFWLAVTAFLTMADGGAVQGEVYSMQVSKAPLERVLDDLSRKSGVTFIYDKAWADFPITVQFRNMALEPALKRIFSNLSHAIIYNTDGTVVIRIYESGKADYTPAAGGRSGTVVEESAFHRPGEEERTEEPESAAEETAEEGRPAEEAAEPPEKQEASSASEEAQETQEPAAGEAESPEAGEPGGQEDKAAQEG